MNRDSFLLKSGCCVYEGLCLYFTVLLKKQRETAATIGALMKTGRAGKLLALLSDKQFSATKTGF